MSITTNVELFEALSAISSGKPGHGRKLQGHGNDTNHTGAPKCKHARKESSTDTFTCRHAKTTASDMKCKHGRETSRQRILIALLNTEGAHQKDIVNALGIKPSSVSEQIDILESHGYLTKVLDEKDKRATIIKLTEAGIKKAKEEKVAREEKLESLFSTLTSEEKSQLLDLLKKIQA